MPNAPPAAPPKAPVASPKAPASPAAPAARAPVPVSRVAAARAEPTTGSHAILVENLEKVYRNGTHAVRGVSFHVREGEIFGLLGPNGAGKSTIIGILGTLVRPTKGRAVVDGIDVTKDSMGVRRRIGFAMQEAGVDELATGREFLLLQARLQGVAKDLAKRRAVELLKLFELDDAGDKRISSYSGGMKRRIDLASALIHEPRILFLDEPTEGLDPRSRQTMYASIQRLRQLRHTTVLLSTHYMDEADKLCDRLAILDQGRIVAMDAPARLKAAVGGQSVILDYGAGGLMVAQADQVIKTQKLAPRTARTGTELHCYVPDAANAAPRIIRALDAAKLPPVSLRIQQPSLDDVYLKYTGRKIEEAEAKTNGGEKKK